MAFDLEAFVRKHLQPLSGDKQVDYTEEDLLELIDQAGRCVASQPMFLELSAPMVVVGSVYGQFADLLGLLTVGGWPPKQNWLFLGDYVDRGSRSLECICLLLAFKIRYPNNFFLLRGAHECASMNKHYGFFHECEARVSSKIWKEFNELFNYLPIAALVNRKIFCVHGGLSPKLLDFDQLRYMRRPLVVEGEGLACDLLFSDPHKDVVRWAPNTSGLSFMFGTTVVEEFRTRFDLELIVRTGQIVQLGYQFFGDRNDQKSFVTIFSAANYGNQFTNRAGLLEIGPNLECAFKTVEVPPRPDPKTSFISRMTEGITDASGFILPPIAFKK